MQESVEVTAGAVTVAVSREGRLSDTFGRTEVQNLPLPQRDVFLLPRMSAGAAFIPGAANSTKLSSSPVITVNGNRYRGNNYVLDGAMNTNPNNTGEPAIVPALEAVEEVQVQTLNFAAEFGRGNGAVINVQTRSGTNELRGRVWEYFRSDALNARNHFSSITPPQTFNQFGTTLGGPILRNQTFFFGSYEGTRNEVERPFAFQVETPELRDYVLRTSPDSVAAELLRDFPAPSPDRGSDGRYLDQRDLVMPGGTIPAIGRANVLLSDDVRFDQYFGRVDHVLGSTHRLSARWIGEHQRDEGGTSSSAATLGRALRGSRGPFDGFFGNLNVGAQQILGRAVNDARVSYQIIDTTRGAADAIVPTVNITGITAPFGDVFESTTRLRTFEFRDVLTLERGQHAIRVGGEVRRVTKGLAIGPPTAGSFTFTTLSELRRRSAVPPAAHRRSGQRRADRLPALFHAVPVGPVHPGPVDDQPAPEPQPRAAARLLRHRDRGGRPAVVDRPRRGRHVPAADRRREHRPRRSALRAREGQLLAAHRPGLGSGGQRPDVDPQRLQPGLPAAPRAVDLGRAGAAAGRASTASSSRRTASARRSCTTSPCPTTRSSAAGSTNSAACRAVPASRRSASPASSSTRPSRPSTPRAGS